MAFDIKLNFFNYLSKQIKMQDFLDGALMVISTLSLDQVKPVC